MWLQASLLRSHLSQLNTTEPVQKGQTWQSACACGPEQPVACPAQEGLPQQLARRFLRAKVSSLYPTSCEYSKPSASFAKNQGTSLCIMHECTGRKPGACALSSSRGLTEVHTRKLIWLDKRATNVPSLPAPACHRDSRCRFYESSSATETKAAVIVEMAVTVNMTNLGWSHLTKVITNLCRLGFDPS